MNLFHFFQKYLDKQNNVEFGITWEKFVQSKIKRFVAIVVFVWLFGTFLLGYLFITLLGVFFGFVLMIIFTIYFGYILFIQTLRFLAFNNTRYIQSKMDIDANVINYEDVVE